MKQYRPTYTRGFTLVEMIVSLGLFAVVSTMAVGTVLVLVDTNQDLRGEQSTITNVSFALDVMSRDIRTGFDYFCDSEPSGSIFSGQNSLSGSSNNCNSGMGGADVKHGVSFVVGDVSDSDTGGTTERMAYYYDRSKETIMRRIGNNAPESILSDSITLRDADFIVTGASTGDKQQPTVTILLEVAAEDEVPFELQTTVTQRFLDI